MTTFITIVIIVELLLLGPFIVSVVGTATLLVVGTVVGLFCPSPKERKSKPEEWLWQPSSVRFQTLSTWNTALRVQEAERTGQPLPLDDRGYGGLGLLPRWEQTRRKVRVGRFRSRRETEEEARSRCYQAIYRQAAKVAHQFPEQFKIHQIPAAEVFAAEVAAEAAAEDTGFSV